MSSEAASRGARMLAWLVVVLAAVFIVIGAVWYGFSPEVRQRFWRDILDRPGGPMSFRFFLQPSMAAIAAIHDGIKDARHGRSPYFWTILSNPAERGDRLREGLISTARIILLGFGMDAIYQYKVLNTFYPVEALLIAFLLAAIPYFLIRGPVDRCARWWFARARSNSNGRAGD